MRILWCPISKKGLYKHQKTPSCKEKQIVECKYCHVIFENIWALNAHVLQCLESKITTLEYEKEQLQNIILNELKNANKIFQNLV